MDARSAIRLAHSPLWLTGVSHNGLAYEVNAHPKSHVGGLQPVNCLNGRHTIRIVDALLCLAEATAVGVHADLYEAYKHWATLRYLGVFDVDRHGGLRLSAPGREVGGNQRRVMSEELGIALGTLMAKQWARSAWGLGRYPVHIVDIDEALTAGKIVKGGWRKTIRQPGSFRPDYLVLTDRVPAGGPRARVLECKGTKSVAHSVTQLAHASHQLRGVQINGGQPPGLAVSFLGNGAGVGVRALELPDTRRSSIGDGIGAGTALPYPDLGVDLALSDLPESFDPDGDEPVVINEDMLSIAYRASLANLSSFAGNTEGFDKWAPSSLRAKTRNDRGEVVRSEAIVSGGIRARGIRSRTPLPGGDLEVFYGLAVQLDDAIRLGTAEDVFDVQRSLAADELSDFDEGPDLATAFSHEGAVLQLRVSG